MTRLTAGVLEVAVAYAVPYGAAAGALLVACAAVAARRSRRRSAATRHAVWTAAVLAHPLLVVLAAWVPARGAALPTRVSAVVTGWAPGRPGAVVRTPAREAARGRATLARAVQETVWGTITKGRSGSPRGRPQHGAPARAPALVALWLAGALTVLLRPAVGRWQVRRLARAGVPLAGGPWRATADEVVAGFGLRRRVELRRAAGPVVPMTWGVARPTVLLPADADAWPAPRRRAVLAHELAHVRRWDAATQGLADLALAAFWFDPLVWLAVRRMRAERERACDDLALRAGLRPSEYAGELLACARALAFAWPPPRGALAFVRSRAGRPPARRSAARRSEFEARVHAVLDARQVRTPWTRGRAAALAGAATGACAALASARPVSPVRALDTSRAATPSAGARPAAGPFAPRGAADRVAGSPRPNVPASGSGGSATGSTAHPATTSAPNASRPGVPPLGEAPSAAIPWDTAPPGLAPSAARVAPAPSPAADPPAPPGEPARDPMQETSAACDAADTRPGTMWVYADVPGGGRRTEYRRTAAGRCAQVAVVGAARLDQYDADVAALAPGTVVLVREVVRAPGVGVGAAVAGRGVEDRALRITAGPDGQPVHAYTVGGRPAAFDAGARAWLTDVAPRLVREAGIDAPARVARWRAEGGVPAVLRGVAGLESTVARRTHYLALLDGTDGGGRRDAGRAALAPGEAAAVAAQARRDLARSPDDLRDVLARLAPP